MPATLLTMLVTGLILPAGSAHAKTLRSSPVQGKLSSTFGWRNDPMHRQPRFHTGIDIAAPSGSPVYATQPGTVAYSGRYANYGNIVVIKHDNGLQTLYGHNQALWVRPGQRVVQGQMIASVGSSGRSTGPHLHFEVHRSNQYVNPIDYLVWLQNQQQPLRTAPVPDNAVASDEEMGTPAYDEEPVITAYHGHTVEVVHGNAVKSVRF